MRRWPVADVVVLLNPLDVSRRRRLHLGDAIPLLERLDELEPARGPVTRAVYVNGHECTDRAYRTQPGDEVLVAFTPGAVGGYELAVYAFQALAAYAIGIVVSKLFPQKAPTAADIPSPSQVYGIGQASNQARLGQPIPVIYGAVVATPDYAAQPYTFFSNNEQYLHAIFCLGMGDHTVLEMLLGDSSAAPLPSTVAQWYPYLPADHHSQFGVIQAAHGIRENVVTCSNVADQELLAPNAGTGTPNYLVWYWRATNGRTSATVVGVDLSGALSVDGKLALMPQNPNIGQTQTATYRNRTSAYEVFDYIASDYQPNTPVNYGDLVPPPTYGTGSRQWIGPFECCKPGQRGHQIEVDITFPSGLFTFFSPQFGGGISPTGLVATVEVTPIDDSGSPTGGPVLYDQQFVPNVNPPNTPQRYTRTIAVASGRYRVRVARITNLDSSTATTDRCVWTGLKFVLNDIPPSQVVYGPVTLVAVQLKATNGVAASASGSVRLRCVRKLAPLGVGATAQTSNPADAFVDILTAAYGGARPNNATEIDQTELAASRAAWAGANGFNGIFDQPSTVWEALCLSVQTVHAAPLPAGSRMSLVHDGVQPVATQLFTDANITAGSLQITADWDTVGTPAGVRVNYRDPQSFSPVALLSPPNVPDYNTVDLFGCTSATVAGQFATLTAAKRAKQRMRIQFETELEGLNVQPGDRIGVQAGMVAWAQAARVVSVAADGVTITTDTRLDWSGGAAFAVQLRDPTGAPVRVTGVTQGASPNVIVLPSAPSFPLTGANALQEATSLAFGVQDQEITDWTVNTVTPNGATVQLGCVNYDASIYAGTAAFTRAPVTLEEVS